MTENTFRRSVSTDTAPRGSRCEWCGGIAVFHLTAIGGLSHNDSGLFCRECGEDFSRVVVQAAANASAVNYQAR